MERATVVELCMNEIDWKTKMDQFLDPKVGGIGMFLGTTRDSFGDKTVVRLEYEGYQPMAIKKIKEIVEKARLKYPELVGVCVIHRLGVVMPTESSIFVLCTSVHRKDALEGVAWLMDEIKATVPIWKKEIYSDGSSWKENAESIRCCKRLIEH